jgi:S-adenosylmethionine:tRNA ribosyltransferase-isomerase
MKVDLFDFDLPEEFIASEPLEKRDEAKLLCVPELAMHKVKDLVDILPPNALIVFNNTKVLPARLHGVCGGREYTATLHKNLADSGSRTGAENRWLAFIKGSKKLRIGDEISFGNGELEVIVADKKGEAGIELRFDKSGSEFFDILDRIGEMPLPPYIKRAATHEDEKNYQTVYAKEQGAVAAPTAGLHFTDELLAALMAKGFEFAYLTLHVGAGTFKPVTAEDTENHVMHSEYGVISPAVAASINNAKKTVRPIVAIGTTTLRLLESAVKEDGTVAPFAGETDIFITPGYKFNTADYLMTNFHLPRSTLFMLVCAFAGIEEMKKAYEFAKENDFRFYSYGDASLLKRKDN